MRAPKGVREILNQVNRPQKTASSLQEEKKKPTGARRSVKPARFSQKNKTKERQETKLRSDGRPEVSVDLSSSKVRTLHPVQARTLRGKMPGGSVLDIQSCKESCAGRVAIWFAEVVKLEK